MNFNENELGRMRYMATSKTGRSIKITKHSRERFVERVFSDEIFKEWIVEAWENGTDITETERLNVIAKGMYKSGYWESYYRKYNGHIFIFRKRKSSIILITVI